MECNYFQVLEGVVDTVHAGILHLGAQPADRMPAGTFAEYMLRDRTPRYSVVDTQFGTSYGAYRDGPAGQDYWRIGHFLLPFYGMPGAALLGGGPTDVFCAVPMDDHSCLFIALNAPGYMDETARRATDAGGNEEYRAYMAKVSVELAGGSRTLPNTSDWDGRFRMIANAANDYLIDRQVQRRKEGYAGYTGIPSVTAQDAAMTNSEGPIYDRSREHLGSSDAMIIRSRRRLIQAANTYAESGLTPLPVEHPEYYRVRGGGVLLPKGVDWVDATKDLQTAFAEHPDLDRSITGGL
jgi:hypothetical protein